MERNQICKWTGYFIQWRHQKNVGLEWSEERAVGDSWALVAAAGNGEERPPLYQDVSRPPESPPPSTRFLMPFSVINTLAEITLSHIMGPSGAPRSSPLTLNQEDQLSCLSLPAGVCIIVIVIIITASGLMWTVAITSHGSSAPWIPVISNKALRISV